MTDDDTGDDITPEKDEPVQGAPPTPPTAARLKRITSAVVLLGNLKDADPVNNDDMIRDLTDFRLTETEARDAWFDDLVVWAAKDGETNGDVVYVIVEITDTQAEPMVLGKMVVEPFEVGSPFADFAVAIQHDPSLIIAPARKVKAPSGSTKPPAKKSAKNEPTKVRPRKASAHKVAEAEVKQPRRGRRSKVEPDDAAVRAQRLTDRINANKKAQSAT